MNDEFNNYSSEPESSSPSEENVPVTEEPVFNEPVQQREPIEVAPIQDEAFETEQPAQAEEIPTVETQKVEHPENPVYTSQPYTNYTQSNSQYNNYNAYGSNNNQTYYYPNQQNQQPNSNKNKKNRKGLKIFAACLAIALVFALGFGVASISKSSDSSPDASSSQSGGKNNANGPELTISNSPVSSNTSADGVLSAAEIHEKLSPSNVGIVVYTKNSNSSAGEGSGIIMGEDSTGEYTYIITCAHVISNSGIQVRIQTEDGTTYDAEIVGIDSRTDIGVLKIKASGLPAAEFGDSDSLRVGDPVYAIGNPGGMEFFGSLTGGYVSAIGRSVSSEIGYTMECIQHSAAINPGNSGGMLVNAYGQVIGINSQKIAATDYEGMGFAIPITDAKEIIDNLIAYSYVPNRPKLGITYYSISSSAQYSMIAQIKGLPAGTLIINEISSDSSLANTEVRQYDMITAVDGEPLSTSDVLLEKIDNGKVGDTMTLSICRVNSNYSIEEFEIEVTLVEDKGNAAAEETTTVYYVDPFEYFNQFGY